MNRERIKELLPIFEAFANGEAIEFRKSFDDEAEEWFDLPDDPMLILTFPADDYEYRIKPKAREFEIIVMGSGYIRDIADKKDGSLGGEVIKVREVLK